jgi:aarF domain-containing kinase
VAARSFFKMALVDNFVHADLHPGNILVRGWRPGGPAAADKVGGDSKEKYDGEPTLVFLDAGLTVELSAVDQRNFTDLFRAVAMADGALAARLMVERSALASPENVPSYERFCVRMGAVVEQVASSKFALRSVKIGAILTEVFSTTREHGVPVEPAFINLVTAIVVVEGLGRQLHPELDLFRCAVPYMSLRHAAALVVDS